MPEELTKDSREHSVLAVPGVLCVSPTKSGRKVVHLGPSAGWMIPRGIERWEQEVSFVRRDDMTAELAKALHATRPHEQIAPKRFASAARAVEASPLLALSGNLAEAARKEGVRVHTVGVDRVSADFYYFAEGGAGEPVRVQGNLVEMLADRVGAATTNAEIEALQVSLIHRLLSALSQGVVSELDVELAGALPRLSRDGTGLLGIDLEAFEAQAQAIALESARFEAAGRRLAEVLASAASAGQRHASVPLYGEAQRETMAPLEVQISGKPLQLPESFRWTVTGAAREMRIDSPAKLAARPPLAQAPAKTGAAGSKPKIEIAPTATGAARATADGKAGAATPAPAEAEPVKAPADAKPDKPAVAEATQPKREVAAKAVAPVARTSKAAPPVAQGALRSAARAERNVSARAQSRAPAAAVPKRAALVPILLLLGVAASLYFLWRTLP